MTTSQLAAAAATLALLTTSASAGECCGRGGVHHAPVVAAPVAAAPVYGMVVPVQPVQVYGAPAVGTYGAAAYGGGRDIHGTPYGQPGGYSGQIGSPYLYPSSGEPGYGGDVYSNHFGPGFHRHSQSGHYRFPYYSYRRPWYHVGPPAYAADTNLPW